MESLCKVGFTIKAFNKLLETSRQLYRAYRNYLPWYVVGLLLLLVSLWLLLAVRPYNSDDVGTQTLLGFFQSHGLPHGTTWVGPDTFVIKIPSYWLMGLLGLSPYVTLVLESICFNIFAFGAFGAVLAWFSKRNNISPFMYGTIFIISCISVEPALSYLATPNFRASEIGLVFIIIAWMIAAIQAKISFAVSIALGLTIAAVSSLLVYSDPYFYYVFFLPTLAWLGLRQLFVRVNWREVSIILWLGVAVKLGGVWSLLFQHYFHYSRVGASLIPTLIPLNQLFPNVVNAMNGILALYDGLFFGHTLGSVNTSRLILNTAYVAFMIGIAVWVFRLAREERLKDQEWFSYFAILSIAGPIVYIMSQTTPEVIYRYFISLYFFLPFAALYGANKLRYRHQVVMAALILVLALLNLRAISLPVLHAHSKPNSNDIALVAAVKSQGLTKGYAPYWVAVIDNYLSKGSPQFTQAICDGTYRAHYWWLDDDALKLRADKSFIVLDKADWMPHCSEDQIVKQFGQPIKRQVLQDRYTLLVYGYDITNRLGTPYVP